MRVTSFCLAACVALTVSAPASAEFLDGLEQERIAPLTAAGMPAASLAALDAVLFLDANPAETAALIAADLAPPSSELAALDPGLFLEPYEVVSAALVAEAFAPSVDTTASVAVRPEGRSGWAHEIYDERAGAFVLP